MEIPAGHREGKGSDARLPEVAYIVLGHIGRAPQGVHGYQLGRNLVHAYDGLGSVRLGQLYHLLRRLERAGLVSGRVEADSPRLRYRFTITPEGESCFRQWLRSLPRGSRAIADELLLRLQFADRLPGGALLTLIDEAVHACENDLEELKASAHGVGTGEPQGVYAMALEARLTADRRWLEDVRRLAEQSLTESGGNGLVSC
jgi:DNA-binding PadR family transcriptional regulator